MRGTLRLGRNIGSRAGIPSEITGAEPCRDSPAAILELRASRPYAPANSRRGCARLKRDHEQSFGRLFMSIRRTFGIIAAAVALAFWAAPQASAQGTAQGTAPALSGQVTSAEEGAMEGVV